MINNFGLGKKSLIWGQQSTSHNINDCELGLVEFDSKTEVCGFEMFFKCINQPKCIDLPKVQIEKKKRSYC